MSVSCEKPETPSSEEKDTGATGKHGNGNQITTTRVWFCLVLFTSARIAY